MQNINKYKKTNLGGFIQIPILIIAVLGILGISTGGYYVLKEVFNNEQIDKSENIETETTDIEEVFVDTSTTSSETIPEEIDTNLDLNNFVKDPVPDYTAEIEVLDEKFNSLRWLANEVDETRIYYEKYKEYEPLFDDLAEDIQNTLETIYSIKKDIGKTELELSDKIFIDFLDTREEQLFSDLDYINKRIAIVEEFENSISKPYDNYEYQEVDLSDVYSTYDDINDYLDNLEPLKTETSNCKYPEDKYILIPNKGWTEVKQCNDGSYIEANKYKYNNNDLTPEQQCAQRKAGALSNYIGGKVDCSDLGI
jgi:hypothetical protein